MKKFDGYCMKGITEYDNKAILAYQERQIEMSIDPQGRVWSEGGIYIADATEAEAGGGIYCK